MNLAAECFSPPFSCPGMKGQILLWGKEAKENMFRGSITAMITPFRNGKVDETSLFEMVSRQVTEGAHGVVPCGTTGEAPTLTQAEHKRVIEISVAATQGEIPVIAGCGTNCTEKTIELARQSEQAGADALLVVTPYYNKPTQEGLYLHFKAVAGSTGLPLLIYNIPGRSAVDMTPETMARLYQDCDNIVGVKDATGDLDRPTRQRELMGDDFIQLSGDDITALQFNQKGGVGCISVTGNIAPGLCSTLQDQCQAENFDKAKKVAESLALLNETLFVETNPVPVKYAAHLLGMCRPDVRLPLAPLSDKSKKVIQAALRDLGLYS